MLSNGHTDRHTDRPNYSNPRYACALRLNHNVGSLSSQYGFTILWISNDDGSFILKILQLQDTPSAV